MLSSLSPLIEASHLEVESRSLTPSLRLRPRYSGELRPGSSGVFSLNMRIGNILVNVQ